MASITLVHGELSAQESDILGRDTRKHINREAPVGNVQGCGLHLGGRGKNVQPGEPLAVSDWVVFKPMCSTSLGDPGNMRGWGGFCRMQQGKVISF